MERARYRIAGSAAIRTSGTLDGGADSSLRCFYRGSTYLRSSDGSMWGAAQARLRRRSTSMRHQLGWVVSNPRKDF